MNVLTLQSTYGGLLHDTGKAVYRAGGQRGSHSEQGCQFLHGVLSGADWAPVLDCVRYHHAAALRGAAKRAAGHRDRQRQRGLPRADRRRSR